MSTPTRRGYFSLHIYRFRNSFRGVLKEWYHRLGAVKQDQFHRLGSVDEVVAVLHQEFIGDSNLSMKELRKEYFDMKRCSLKRWDIERHYQIMSQRFYQLNGYNDPSLKNTYVSSLPEELQEEMHRMIAVQQKDIVQMTLGEIQTKPFIQQTEVQPDGKLKSVSQAEEVLNWQTENSLAQNKLLKKIDSLFMNDATPSFYKEDLISHLHELNGSDVKQQSPEVNSTCGRLKPLDIICVPEWDPFGEHGTYDFTQITTTLKEYEESQQTKKGKGVMQGSPSSPRTGQTPDDEDQLDPDQPTGNLQKGAPLRISKWARNQKPKKNPPKLSNEEMQDAQEPSYSPWTDEKEKDLDKWFEEFQRKEIKEHFEQLKDEYDDYVGNLFPSHEPFHHSLRD